ncbi:TIGR01906 family membrane protein [archaeon]|nr:TIGR01906 family membrane protein [archaeon]|tara:strand:- start:92 stop:733 length:642 start_codon:yes stop_codon:yes gene_type:complete
MKSKYTIITLAILISISIILLGFKLTIFNENTYKDQFTRYNIYNSFQEKELNQNLTLLLNYLKNNNQDLKTNFFNQKEKTHLSDVKSIIKNLTSLLYSLLIIILISFSYLIYNEKYKTIRKSLILGSIITILIILIFYTLTLINFDKIFLYFHLISFSNNLWLLNPETDNLIKMFPQDIFLNITTIAIIKSLIISIIILILSLINHKKTFKTS